MTGQFDLFGAGPAPVRRGIQALPQPARPPTQYFPTPPSVEWAKLLTAHGQHAPAWIHVSWFWTGVIAEVLKAGSLGGWGWHRDNGIITFLSDPECTARIIYMHPPAAEELHRAHPMLPIGKPGTSAARFRFAGPDESVTAELDLPLTVALQFEKVKA